MKAIKIQIKSIYGIVLFEYEKENNTIKETVLEAIKNSADLRFADLRFADLRFADLRFADLHSANLRSANLYYANLYSADLHFANLHSADLSSANLHSADLHFANLHSADLSSANLHSADLHSANLSSANLHSANLYSADLSSATNLNTVIKLPMYCKWDYGITNNKIHIGCEKRSIKEWDKFFKSKEVLETKRDTEEFKQIEAVYKGLKAYYNYLNK